MDGKRYNLSERDRQQGQQTGKEPRPSMFYCSYVSNGLIMDASLKRGIVMGKSEFQIAGLEIGDRILLVEKMRSIASRPPSGYPLVADVPSFNGFCRRIALGTVVGDRYYCLDNKVLEGLPYPYRCSVHFDTTNPDTFLEDVEFSTSVYPVEIVNAVRLSIACGGNMRGRMIECPVHLDKLIQTGSSPAPNPTQ